MPEPTTTPEPLSERLLRDLWLRMNGQFGHRWASGFGAAPDNDDGTLTLTARVWAHGLAGITPRQLGFGLRATLASPDTWPPTLPEFRARCLGIPSIAAAKAALRDPTNAPPRAARFSRLMWQHADSYRLRQASAELADRMLREAYELAAEAVLRGTPLPPLSPALSAPTPPPANPAKPETVASAFSEIADVLGTTPDFAPDPEPEPAPLTMPEEADDAEDD
ncbi:MAG TPA: hypothetical protein VFG73_02385 [Rhodanobacteraceae bacterium]|nr:hypothetical protein [Rhodanobacteraceae bacterium]